MSRPSVKVTALRRPMVVISMLKKSDDDAMVRFCSIMVYLMHKCMGRMIIILNGTTSKTIQTSTGY